ncbi:Ribonuclease BN [Symmachiella macrocystis]|uniref:Ribonuclease BN n=1 Tax=Symmachiella macrocystis TaxID=2527985 RepID=A0A5C6BGW0_9PLAN|nr:MBL fold metallo-hydrolase [Symmachiella macrocystis]TWU09684.1 Ribonuclease BN [Symmachiella macrocystis]
MKLQFLGTGGYHPTEQRHTSCVLLPDTGIAFDAGTSFFRVPSRLKTDELDVFLSHAHLDHIIGLTYFIVPLLSGQIKQVRVHGRTQDLDAVRTHLFSKPLFPVLPEFDFREIQQSYAVADGGTLTHVPLKHPGGSLGYRIDWPKQSLAYLTDTTVDPDYLEFIRGVDVLIHECNFTDDMSQWCETTGHSNTSAVAQLARDAEVGRLYLTHFDPQNDGNDPVGLEIARGIFPESAVAEDLLEIEF